MDCPYKGWVCTDSMFVEESTPRPQPLSICSEMFKLNKEVKVYTRGTVDLQFYHDSMYVLEFSTLDVNNPINSSELYLLSEDVKTMVHLIRDSIGVCSIFPLDAFLREQSDTAGLFSVTIAFDDYYHLQALYGLFERHTQGRPFLSQRLPSCVLLTSAVSTEGSPTQSLISTDGGIRLENMHGAFTIIDVSGRILHQGVLADGETPRFITLQPGVYMVVTPTERQQVLVMP